MTAFAKDAVFTVTAGLEANMVPDGCVLYDARRERVHFLNPTALLVYELCRAGLDVAAIENYVGAAYSLSDVPTDDVGACLKSLVGEGIVRPCR
jgi:hypothetical protein